MQSYTSSFCYSILLTLATRYLAIALDHVSTNVSRFSKIDSERGASKAHTHTYTFLY